MGDIQEEIPRRNSSYVTERYPRVDTSVVDPNLPEYVANYPEFMARHRDRVQRGRHEECRRDHVLKGLVMSEGGIGTYRAVEIPIGMLRGANDFRRLVDREIFGQTGKQWCLEFDSMSKFDDWVREMAVSYYGHRITLANLQLHLTEIDCCAEHGSLHFGGCGEEMQGRVAFQMTRWANIMWTLNGCDNRFQEEDWPLLFQSGVTFKAERAPYPPITAQRPLPAVFEFNRSIPQDSGYFSLPPRFSRTTHVDPTFHHVCAPSRYVILEYKDINGRVGGIKIPPPEGDEEFLLSVYKKLVLGDGQQTLKFMTNFGEFVSWMEDAREWMSFTQLQIQVHEVMVKKLGSVVLFSDILTSATMVSSELVPEFDLSWSSSYHEGGVPVQVLSNIHYPKHRSKTTIIDGRHWSHIKHMAEIYHAYPSFPVPLPQQGTASNRGERDHDQRDGTFRLHFDLPPREDFGPPLGRF